MHQYWNQILSSIILLKNTSRKVKKRRWEKEESRRLSVFRTATNAKSAFVRGRRAFLRRQSNYQCYVIWRSLCSSMIQISKGYRTLRVMKTSTFQIFSTRSDSASFSPISIMTELVETSMRLILSMHLGVQVTYQFWIPILYRQHTYLLIQTWKLLHLTKTNTSLPKRKSKVIVHLLLAHSNASANLYQKTCVSNSLLSILMPKFNKFRRKRHKTVRSQKMQRLKQEVRFRT